MLKVIQTLLLSFILAQTFGQTQKKFTTYLLVQYTKTIADRTIGNNPWAIGFGVQAFLNNKSKFKPTVDLTTDAYFEDDKVLRQNSNGSLIKTVGGMTNVFVGTSFNPVKTFYVSVVAGPGFVTGQTLFGIKPSLGFYFSKKQKWTGKISYINIFNRDNTTQEDFTSISFSMGLKLF